MGFTADLQSDILGSELVTTAAIHPNVIAGETPTLSPIVPASPDDLDKQHELGQFPRACLKIARGAAARDFGCGQGGEVRAGLAIGASPQRAVSVEPTPPTGTRPAARRVFEPRAVWLRCSSVTGRWQPCSFVAPRHPALCSKTAPLGIFRQAPNAGLRHLTLNPSPHPMRRG